MVYVAESTCIPKAKTNRKLSNARRGYFLGASHDPKVKAALGQCAACLPGRLEALANPNWTVGERKVCPLIALRAAGAPETAIEFTAAGCGGRAVAQVVSPPQASGLLARFDAAHGRVMSSDLL